MAFLFSLFSRFGGAAVIDYVGGGLLSVLEAFIDIRKAGTEGICLFRKQLNTLGKQALWEEGGFLDAFGM